MGAMILAEIVASGTETPDFIIILESPFTNTILERIFETLCIAIFILKL